jgi:hypothetical protein
MPTAFKKIRMLKEHHIFTLQESPLRFQFEMYSQYGETNVMHFLFNLLRIKGLCMFRALLAYPQEALHKRHLVHCVRVMSVACTGAAN